MWFSDRGYPCHFPEGWRVNDLNPKELKPFASGAGPRFATKKLSLRGMHPLGVSPNKKTDWWIDSDDFFLVDIGEFGKNMTSLKTSPTEVISLVREFPSSITKGLVVWKKWNRFVFGRGMIWGLWLKGRPGDLCVCVCFFLFDVVMLCCLMLCVFVDYICSIWWGSLLLWWSLYLY